MIKGQLKDVNVSYNKKDLVLKSLNLDIYEGELLSLLGPSGCGKSTTLRTIAGFIETQSGTFMLDEKDITKQSIHQRDFGIVFQSYALFPHLSVFDNVAFGLKLRKMDKQTIETKVNAMLAICDLNGLETRFPKNLSGGQRQRVALARALVIEPKLLLLDEPLSNLDAQLRIQMRNEIKRIQRELEITTIFVTHDQEECFAISDRVAIMKDGRIEQLGTPESIYSQPNTEYVARFVGFENFMSKAVWPHLFEETQATLACIRPDDVLIETEGSIEGQITAREFLGSMYQYTVETVQGTFTVFDAHKYEEQMMIKLSIPIEKVCYITEEL